MYYSEGGEHGYCREITNSEGGKDNPQVVTCNHTTILSTTDKDDENALKHPNFDTDSVPIKVDNCCTRTISFCREDFLEDTLTPVHNKVVKSFSGTLTPITHEGTIQWWVSDDDGTTRKICVPKSYLVPNGTTRLLSPQHWAQQINDNIPLKRGTWCATYDDEVILHWNQREFQKTIKLDQDKANIATMWTAPGYHKFNDFLADANNAEALAMVFDTEVTIEDRRNHTRAKKRR